MIVYDAFLNISFDVFVKNFILVTPGFDLSHFWNESFDLGKNFKCDPFSMRKICFQLIKQNNESLLIYNKVYFIYTY